MCGENKNYVRRVFFWEPTSGRGEYCQSLDRTKAVCITNKEWFTLSDYHSDN